MQSPLVIGTRGSPLALAQTKQVRRALAVALEVPVEEEERLFPIEVIKTSGDQIQDRRLIEAGGKGLFTKEIEEALLEGRIGLAIHSMKDVPTENPDGLVLAGSPPREDPRDAFICYDAATLDDLPAGARVGTASLRRQAQTLNRRPDLEIVNLRGNVGTRLDKIAAGEADATYLAVSGLKRLGRPELTENPMPVDVMLPAAAQGALALQVREDDARALEITAHVADRQTTIAIAAERAFLAALDGSCRTPIAALAEIADGDLRLRGEALTPDGAQKWARDARAPLSGDFVAIARMLGETIGGEIREEAGDAIRYEL